MTHIMVLTGRKRSPPWWTGGWGGSVSDRHQRTRMAGIRQHAYQAWAPHPNLPRSLWGSNKETRGPPGPGDLCPAPQAQRALLPRSLPGRSTANAGTEGLAPAEHRSDRACGQLGTGSGELRAVRDEREAGASLLPSLPFMSALPEPKASREEPLATWGSGRVGRASQPLPQVWPRQGSAVLGGEEAVPSVLRVGSTCAGRAGLTPLVSERKGSWHLQGWGQGEAETCLTDLCSRTRQGAGPISISVRVGRKEGRR